MLNFCYLRVFRNPIQSRFLSRLSRHEETQEKLIKTAIIGLPNSGKSTFINSIVNSRVCATSDKVHTTQTLSQAISCRNSSQIICYDTPGLVTKQEVKKHKLDEGFMSSCRRSIQNSSLIGVVHDVSNHWTRHELHPLILDLLREYQKIPSFLVLNKIDKFRSKSSLLEIIRSLTCNNLSLTHLEINQKNQDQQKPKHVKGDVGWPNFKSVFMVSSLQGDGIEKVVQFIESYATKSPWEYKENEISDQKPEKLIEQFTRARLLDYLPQEIPYQVQAQIEYFSNENNKIFASVIVSCPSNRIERLVCGIGDGKLRQITDRVTSDLVQCFKCPVSLTLSTVVLKS